MTKIERVVVFEGKKALRIEKCDRIWIEFYILLWAFFGIAFMLLLKEFGGVLPGSGNEVYSIASALGASVFVFHVIFSF